VTERKSYSQFCGLARALDRVGDRWTLLIARELLLGSRTFRELEGALPGIGPSLLTKRLNELADDGLVERNEAPRRSKNVEYGLTDAGRSLQPVILELIRWGSRWMLNGPGDDRVDARWAPLALLALLEDQPARRGRVHVDVDGVPVTISSAGRRKITAGHHGRPDATIAAPLPVLLAIAAGALTLRDSGAAVSGDPAVARDLVAGGGGARS
jgi:DNA-binding HxlR family transcriptional regulator